MGEGLKRCGWGLMAMGLAWLGVVGAVWAEPREQTLILGTVTDNPKKEFEKLKPILDYVVGKMKDVGIVKGELFMPKSGKEMLAGVKDGKVDWITDTPFFALHVAGQTGAEILVRKWKSGKAEYAGVIFVRKDAGIADLAGLKGKRVAFGDDTSTTSYFMPTAVLRGAGLTLAPLGSPKEEPPADKVGYAFAKEEINIATWVHKGMAAAGAFSDINFQEDVPEAMRGDLVVLHQTKPIPRAVELTRKGLDEKVKVRLKEVLLKAGEDPEAKEALKAYSKTSKFDGVENAKAGLEEAGKLLENLKDLL